MCKLEQCSRCKNEKLEEGQNYCQICGLDLKVPTQEIETKEQSRNFIKPYSFIEDMKERDRKYAELINLISRHLIDNEMTLKQLDECTEEIKEVYYNYGMIKK